MFSQSPADTGQGARPKTKFVPLFSEEGAAKTVAKLPGIYSVSSKISSQKHAFATLLRGANNLLHTMRKITNEKLSVKNYVV